MPAAAPPPRAIDTYHALIRKCLLTRCSADRFEHYFTQLLARSPIPAPPICDILLSPSLTANRSDPLHLEYVARLLERDVVSLAHVLDALLKTSPVKAATSTSPAATGEQEYGSRELLEQDVFFVCAAVIRSQKPRSPESVWTAMSAMCKWMEAVMAVSGTGMLDDAAGGAAGESADGVGKGRREALAEMLIALGQNGEAVQVLGESGRRERKLIFQTNLSLFAQYVQVQNPGLAAALEGLRQLQIQMSPREGKGGGKAGEAIDGMMMGLGEAENAGPAVFSRGHLFVWLNSLLVGKPHVDDEMILGYLNSRYRDDVATMLTDFITAVIDTITNAILRNESSITLFLLRSFLNNKVPPLLARISPSTVASSHALSQSFLRTDQGALSSLSPGLFDPYAHSSSGAPDMLYIDLRVEFLFACALHQVIGENDIQVVLGELPLGALPNHGLYHAQDLLAQCAMDPHRVDRLLEEIDSVDGNAGAVCTALFEVMKSMCESRETMPLRNICSYLVRRPCSIDILLLFVHLPSLLEPLCEVLDTWRYEEDQGEYQPVYEEFGSILLLVLTIRCRYALPPTDFLQPAPDSFVPRLLFRGATASRIEGLGSSDRHAQLGGWIKELFECEGIGDGLMSSCRPQDFYCLVPTLFAQSVLSCDRGVLELDTLKEGFSFLLEPFLLPSLVLGLEWLGEHIWASPTDLHTPLQVLHSLLVLPPSAPPEKAETHRTVVSLCASRLVRVLALLHHHRTTTPAPELHTIEQMLAQLRPLAQQSLARRGAESGLSREDADGFAHAGFCGAVASAFQSLLHWSLPAGTTATGEQPSPGASYHPRLLPAAVRLAGPERVVNTLAAEVAKARLESRPPGVAEDLAVAFVLAYVPRAVVGLPDALRALEEDFVVSAGAGAGAGGVKGEVVTELARAVERASVPYERRGLDVDVAAAAAGEVEMALAGGLGIAGGVGGMGTGMEGVEMEGLFVGGMDLEGMELG